MKKTSKILIPQCRAALGLSQSELAGLLQVSRSHYSMMELGERNMSTTMLLKLVNLAGLGGEEVEHHLCQEEEQQQAAQCQTFLEDTRRECRYQLQKLERELSKMEERRQQLLRKLSSIRFLHREKTQDRRSKLLLRIMEEDCRRTLERCSLKHIAQLQLQVASIREQVTVIENMMNRSEEDRG